MGLFLSQACDRTLKCTLFACGHKDQFEVQDFDSSWLKTKKHYNSFTTSFFIELSTLEHTLKQGEKLEVGPQDMKALLKNGMICHKCQAAISNIPSLKAHLVLCAKEV